MFNIRHYIFLMLAVLVGVFHTELLKLLNFWKTTETIVESESITLKSKVTSDPQHRLFTTTELASYNGENGAPIYLALLGSVFDVSKGIKHYGPGCSYNFFVGRDASKSFISGEFENYDPQHADDVLTLKRSDLIDLENWKQFYEKDYTYKGKLIGRFYDEHGAPTKYYDKFLALLDQARSVKAEAVQLRTKYPDCNIEWSEAIGTRVWCSSTQDGLTGYPRKLYMRGNKNFHCACVPEGELDALDDASSEDAASKPNKAMFKPYENCGARAHECFYRV